jgi:hypothetical protein
MCDAEVVFRIKSEITQKPKREDTTTERDTTEEKSREWVTSCVHHAGRSTRKLKQVEEINFCLLELVSTLQVSSEQIIVY